MSKGKFEVSAFVVAMTLIGLVSGLWVSGIAPALGYSSLKGESEVVVAMSCEASKYFGREIKGCGDSVYVNGERVPQGLSRFGVRVLKVNAEYALLAVSRPTLFTTVDGSFMPPLVYGPASNTIDSGTTFKFDVKGSWDVADDSSQIVRKVKQGSSLIDVKSTLTYSPKGTAYDSALQLDGNKDKSGVQQLASWTPVGLPAGEYTLQALEYYFKAGKESLLYQYDLIVAEPKAADRTPPVASLVSTDFAQLSTGGYTLMVYAYDPNGIARATATINNQASVTLSKITSDRWSRVIENAWLNVGGNTVRVRIEDGSGNVNENIVVTITKIEAPQYTGPAPTTPPPSGAPVPPTTAPPATSSPTTAPSATAPPTPPVGDLCSPYPDCLDEDNLPSPIGPGNFGILFGWTFGVGLLGAFVDKYALDKKRGSK